MRILITVAMAALIFVGFSQAQAQEEIGLRFDQLRPDAPELAALGPYDIGVRTVEFVSPDRIDVLNTAEGAEAPIYDRPLIAEIWYPAEIGDAAATPYTIPTREVGLNATVGGVAVRDAAPDASAGPYPLVVISHGYPGNRYLLGHLGENLATKGYVVVSIGHTDSLYRDQAAFGSTLLNRSLDQIFMIDTLQALNEDDESFLQGMVDASNTAIIGYSMGGYGALNVVGGGYTAASVDFGFSPPNGLLALRQDGNIEADPRVQAVVAFAPWGRNAGFWDADGLADITTPLLIVAGNLDDIAGYENGVRQIWEETVNAERYLLTFDNARHNAGAPIPAPPVLVENAPQRFDAYADPAWDTVRMNNIAQHFVTAFLGMTLQGQEDLADYLDLIENANDGVFSTDDDGNFTDEHTHWLGFPNRTAVGLIFEAAMPE